MRRVLAAAVATLSTGFMIVDGSRALIVGDYFRPTSGEYAGELGPWADLVRAIGIDPLASGMKTFFVL